MEFSFELFSELMVYFYHTHQTISSSILDKFCKSLVYIFCYFQTKPDDLSCHLSRIRRRRESLGWTGIAAFILGLLFSPMFARLLPFGWDGHVAALIMNADRWGAGTALMQAGNPEAWRGLMDDFNLVKSNPEALGARVGAAAKTKKEQHCSIVVPAP